jgi:hypothetical protein
MPPQYHPSYPTSPTHPNNHQHKQLQRHLSQYKSSVVTPSTPSSPLPLDPLSKPVVLYEGLFEPEPIVTVHVPQQNRSKPTSRMAAVVSAPNDLHGCRAYGVERLIQACGRNITSLSPSFERAIALCCFPLRWFICTKDWKDEIDQIIKSFKYSF